MAATDRRPAPGNPRATDDTTLASIVVGRTQLQLAEAEQLLSSNLADDAFLLAGTDVMQVENLTSFSYSSNVMQMGDPFTVTVPDPRGKYRNSFAPGSAVRFYLSNPLVNGGARTRKVTGIITNREAVSDLQTGAAIRLTGADLGWHLMNNDAPLWFNLRSSTLEKLAEACLFPQQFFPKDTDPGWGFRDQILTSNAQNRATKIGKQLKFSAAEQAGFVAAQMSGSPVFVQVQPGQKISDLLIQYARRIGLMVGVSADGHLQFFLPTYDQPADYVIHHHETDEPESVKNNAQSARRIDQIDTIYTHVKVVGENPIYQIVDVGGIKKFNPQFTRIYGRAKDEALLPFRRTLTMSDGEIVVDPDRRAVWQQKRGLFDAQTVTYVLRGHQQGGTWWESDHMCEVHDSVLGIEGPMYISQVLCKRDMQSGDVTEVTLKRPNLLTEIPL